MRDWLVGTQSKEDGKNMGSWPPDQGTVGKSCGRLGTTAFSILTLELYSFWLYHPGQPAKRLGVTPALMLKP